MSYSKSNELLRKMNFSFGQCKEACLGMQPLQLGLGAKFGMTRMALTAQDYYVQGWPLCEMDAENAFKRVSRQAMLDLFWMGYCSHSPLP